MCMPPPPGSPPAFERHLSSRKAFNLAFNSHCEPLALLGLSRCWETLALCSELPWAETPFYLLLRPSELAQCLTLGTSDECLQASKRQKEGQRGGTDQSRVIQFLSLTQQGLNTRLMSDCVAPALLIYRGKLVPRHVVISIIQTSSKSFSKYLLTLFCAAAKSQEPSSDGRGKAEHIISQERLVIQGNDSRGM